MLKTASLLLLLAGAAWTQSLHVHAGATRDSLAFADVDSIVFSDLTADDATMVAYTKTGGKDWKAKSVDSLKVKPAPATPGGQVDPGGLWMFLGDSQTGGRAEGETKSHWTAFENIWNRTFPAKKPSIFQHADAGFSGRALAATAAFYETRSERTNRTWVHFQESGSQGDGQATAAEFGTTWEAFVRKIKAQSPNAAISTETAFSFGRESEAGRNWDGYNAVLRQKLALVAGDGIKVTLAEVDRNIKALDAAVGAGNVWFQANETNAYHYKNLGNLMVALSMFDAMGYDVNTLDLGGITSVSADYKAKCLEIINKF